MERKVTVSPPLRGTDVWGSGAFGASRAGGSRIHRGIDLACQPESEVLAVSAGTITKIGYPYADAPTYRYVEITTSTKARERYFYVEPLVEIGEDVEEGGMIGTTQCLGTRYPGITEHFHFEVIRGTDYLNPHDYLRGYL